MTGLEWSRYFKTLPVEKLAELQQALHTLALNEVINKEFSGSFKELEYLILYLLGTE